MSTPPRADFIVVGAGGAGAILAARLTEDPRVHVVLVEAGPDYPDFNRLPDELKFGYASASYVTTHGHLWDYMGQANSAQGLAPVPRGKVTGGTTAVNGQVFLRGLPSDFGDWVRKGNDQWSFNAMLPAFKRIETDLDFPDEWHGTDGPLAIHRYRRDEWLEPQAAFVQACMTMGYEEAPDANNPAARGVSPIPFNNVGGIRASTALAYLGPARGRPNLTILAETVARRIRFDGGRAVGVEVSGPGGAAEISGTEVICCGGSIGSPHLLLLSGVGPADQLSALGVKPVVDLPGVGKHLQDHLVVDMLWFTTARYGIPPADSARVQVALRYTASGSPFEDDMQITPRTHPPQPRSGGGERFSVVSLVPTIERPVGSGEVRLRSGDPDVVPHIDFRFLDEAEDLRRLHEGARMCLELAGDGAFGSLLADRLAPAADEIASRSDFEQWLRRSVRTSHHHCGSCKMGPGSDPTAVVDQSGRVHGVEHLRVVDASIFPEVVRANTAATTMAVAERMAAQIAGR